MEKVHAAVMALRQAIKECDECKNVTSIKLFMNAYETKISKTIATPDELNARGISMKNIAGDFIVNDHGNPTLPFETFEPDETGAEW